MRKNVNRRNRTYSSIAVTGFILALVVGGAEILSGFGTQWGLWDYRKGFIVLRWAAYGGLAAGLISLAGCFVTRPGRGRRGLLMALGGLLIAVAVFGIPWSMQQKARQVPAIHDITTDMVDPPPFVALLPLRKLAVNQFEYGGMEIAAKQRAAYPDIIPLELSLSRAEAFKVALVAARDLGWQVVDANEGEGRIEATDTTFWFGFKDDIIVRVAPAARGSRVDVRSVSRVGRSDVGTNAKRIRGYLKKLRGTG